MGPIVQEPGTPGSRITGTTAQVRTRATGGENSHIRTPSKVIERLQVFGAIGLDPCAAPRNVLTASTEWVGDEYEDGLVRSWVNYGLVYCFPPSSQIGDWARKLTTEARAGVEIVALLSCRMHAAWMHDYILPTADAVCYWRGKLRAIGESRNSAAARVVCYWGPRADMFRDAFAPSGSVSLRENIHRPQSWTLVVPRPSPVRTWVEARGYKSKAVKQCIAQFAEEIGYANAQAGCPPATDRRHALITRYGVLKTQPASLRRGGQLVVDVLVARGLLSEDHGYEVEWRQDIDRRYQRTTIEISSVATHEPR